MVLLSEQSHPFHIEQSADGVLGDEEADGLGLAGLANLSHALRGMSDGSAARVERRRLR